MMNKILNQHHFVREYNDETREEFNPDLFYRSDDDIIKEIQKVVLSCQRSKNFLIKVESFEVKSSYEEILEELRLDEMTRNPKDKDNKYNYISLKDSDKELAIVKSSLEALSKRVEFVTYDEAKMTATFVRYPERSELNGEINES